MMNVTDYRLTDLFNTSQDDFENYLQAWLEYAIRDFDICDQDLNFDDTTKEFPVRQVRRGVPGAVLVFIMPPVAAELRRRLEKRREDTPQAVERRLRNARAEVRAYEEFDFVVVNDDLDRAAADLKAVITACRRRPEAMAARLRPILRSFRKGRP